MSTWPRGAPPERWLRPDYQRPRFGKDVAGQAEADLAAGAKRARGGAAKKRAWPKTAVEQMAALLDVVASAPVTVEEAAAAFKSARRELVERHLEMLEIMGEVRRDGEGRFHAGVVGVVATGGERLRPGRRGRQDRRA